MENEHLRSFKLVLPSPVAAHFHRYCDCEGVMILGLPWGWGDEQIKKLQKPLPSLPGSLPVLAFCSFLSELFGSFVLGLYALLVSKVS